MKPTPEDAVRIANLAGLEQVAIQLPTEVRATLLLAVEQGHRASSDYSA